ncbi:hypothetical protein WUBG_00181 [Wuchereria bancrofti]|uniref:Uncharacterized protein n=1 Tax=Wuchereria bancrofti TaxID=6293 RepID=J9FGX5_WUCBA|nr:hypothetical protein WUBG_00181 [Wuchereria bancrofti]
MTTTSPNVGNMNHKQIPAVFYGSDDFKHNMFVQARATNEIHRDAQIELKQW